MMLTTPQNPVGQEQGIAVAQSSAAGITQPSASDTIPSPAPVFGQLKV